MLPHARQWWRRLKSEKGAAHASHSLTSAFGFQAPAPGSDARRLRLAAGSAAGLRSAGALKRLLKEGGSALFRRVAFAWPSSAA